MAGVAHKTDWKRLGWWTVGVVGFWAMIALIISTFTFISVLSGAYYLEWWKVILFEQACILPWTLSTPLLLYVARKYRIEWPLSWKNALVHLLTAAIVFLFHSFGQSLSVALFFNEAFSFSYMMTDFGRFLDMRVVLYAGVLLAVYAMDFYRRDRETLLREPRLRAQLNHIRFEGLKSRIQPGFMLNTIDSIITNLQADADRAEEILADFSDLLRIILQNLNKPEITIREDIAFLRLYFDILQKRYSHTIAFKVRMNEAVLDEKIPSVLFIMPLLEQVIARDPSRIFGLKSFDYIGTINGGELQLKAGLRGIGLSKTELEECRSSAGLTDLSAQLSEEDARQLHTEIKGDELWLELKIPVGYRRRPLMPLALNNNGYAQTGEAAL